ncbi:MAG: Ig-like domain-containing protein, partial [Acidobacteria bacterium]|nr:Ig-like domain-containing protein [Candidatus Sulfomarinibacter sp. MAG AM1]
MRDKGLPLVTRRSFGAHTRHLRLAVFIAVLSVSLSPVVFADTFPPTLVFQSPANDAVVGSTDRFKVEVSDQDGLAASDPVRWGLDGAPISTIATVNTNYACGDDCAVYEFDVDTTLLVDGAHTVRVEVEDSLGNVGVFVRSFVVANSGAEAAGNGLLLRRTHGSQACIDCHNLETHSSKSTGTKYGNWAVDCLICHTP